MKASRLNSIVAFILLSLLFAAVSGAAADKNKQEKGGDKFSIAQIRYGGGGDWYEDRTSITRLQQRVQRDLGLTSSAERKVVKLTDEDLFSYPILY
ncbi:MAG: DUF4159 domain-containing protein, partial [bacterium]